MGSLRDDDIELKSDNLSVLPVNPREQVRILRKMDWHLLPFVTVFFFLLFLDKANIGNATVAGMTTDLKLTGFKYNIAAAVFFIPFNLAEVPSYCLCGNIILKLLRPSCWSAARAFLGLTEAGLYPGNYYICLWYPRSERSKPSVAVAFGGLLAYGIERMNGVGGLYGWQWMFCLEGIVTVLVAVFSFFYMHDYPETANFLTEPERLYIIDVLKHDSNSLSSLFDTQFVWQAMQDYKTYVQILIYLGLLVPGYAIALFSPTTINELGYSAANAQLLSVPPFVPALSQQSYGAVVSLVGYILLYCSVQAGPSYVGVCPAAAGNYPTVAVILAWAGSNAGGDLKRGVVLAMVIGISNLGGVCSSFIYIDPPRFHIGHGTNMGFLSLSIIMSIFAMGNYNRLNRKKEAQCLAENIGDDRRYEFKDMGDAIPLFR
ncbi:MFS general substrate transporter [Suillus tomentosus]|nr:MFS general substrate transporter [Suillus tomentosus]